MATYDTVMSFDWSDESKDGLAAYDKVIADIASKKLVKDVQAMGTDRQRIEDGFHPPRQHSAAVFYAPATSPQTAKPLKKTRVLINKVINSYTLDK
jgi:hypothetical protein